MAGDSTHDDAKAPRVLMVTTVAPTIRAFLLPFAEHFRSLGWRVDAMAQGAADCEACQQSFDRAWDIDWSRNPLAPQNVFGCRREVARVAKSEAYDLVHVHTPVAAFVSRLALRNLRRRSGLQVIYTAHGFHFFQGAPLHRNLLYQTFEKLAARWTDRLIVMNAEDLAAAKRLRLARPESHITYMPGIGVDTETLTRASISTEAVAKARAEIGLSSADAYLLVVAELIPRKRHADILHAFAAADTNGVQLCLAGDGPLRGELEQLSERLSIQDRVRFLGFRDDIPTLVHSARAVVLASNQEGLPRSIMEAMCLGVPVIGSDIRGTRDLLEHGAGILFPIGDIPALTNAIKRVAHQPEEVARIGQAGRDKIADYDIRKVIALHESVYSDALKDAQTRRREK